MKPIRKKQPVQAVPKFRPQSRRARLNPTARRIVQAARAHFFSHGFRSVTMDDLAAELGISKKTLYAHFPSKTTLLEAVLVDKFTSVSSGLEQIRREQSEDFAAVLRQLLAGMQHELDEIKAPFIRDMRLKAPQLFKMIEHRRAEMIQHYFGKLFLAGQRAGVLRKDVPARLMIEVLLGAVQEIMNPHKIEELGLMPKTAFAGIISLVLKGALIRKGEKL